MQDFECWRRMNRQDREKTIEALIGSPPEREELVVQLFFKHGGQWGEIFRDEGVYKMVLFSSNTSEENQILDCEEFIEAISKGLAELKFRLD